MSSSENARPEPRDRLTWWLARLCEKAINPLGRALASPGNIKRLHVVPSLPTFMRHRFESRRGAWIVQRPATPKPLLTVAGINRNPEAEQAAFDQSPLQDFNVLHADTVEFARRLMWREMLPAAPRLERASRAARHTHSIIPSRPSAQTSISNLTKAVRDRAAELGLSAIGIARYDSKFTFAQYRQECADVGNAVIVCVLERNYAATQTIPSATAELAALGNYADVIQLSASLATFINGLGYRASAEPSGARHILLHYAVEAGLGQLGLNGQVLTPVAGSRCGITAILTNAPVVYDEPVDFGVHKICDACQVCVRRCPVGAIPGRRVMYRGVEKAKLNTQRCWPVVAQSHGCGICMKVCPVQKYGLTAVTHEFERSGNILGKDTDDLEGYDWLDGRHYGPGVRPRLQADFVKPPGYAFDPDRGSITNHQAEDIDSGLTPPKAAS